MTVRISAVFTSKQRDRNGLESIVDTLLKAGPDDDIFAIVRWRVLRRSDEIQTGEHIPTVIAHQIEPITDGRLAQVREIFAEATSARLGKDQIPGLDQAIADAENLCGNVYADEAGQELVGFCTQPRGHDAPEDPNVKPSAHVYREDWDVTESKNEGQPGIEATVTPLRQAARRGKRGTPKS
jgi:hypothetical protein